MWDIAVSLLGRKKKKDLSNNDKWTDEKSGFWERKEDRGEKWIRRCVDRNIRSFEEKHCRRPDMPLGSGLAGPLR